MIENEFDKLSSIEKLWFTHSRSRKEWDDLFLAAKKRRNGRLPSDWQQFVQSIFMERMEYWRVLEGREKPFPYNTYRNPDYKA